MPFSFGAKAFGIAKCRPLRRGLPLRSMCGRNLRFPHTHPLPFCDTIQFAIETDRSCHRQRSGAELRSGLFLCSKFVAPVPADLNLPGSKKAPGRVPSFGLYHRLPQDSPSRTRAAERHTKALPYSLFPRPAPAFPSHSLGAPESCSAGGRRISSPAAMRDCKTPFPPAQPRMPGTGSF